MSFVKSAIDSITGKTAARKAEEAAGVAAGAQEQALEYLKEREALPQQLREAALQQLGGIYGLPGIEGAPGREEFVAGLQEDPFYQQMLESGEEAVLRGASATGGLRSGAASEALARSGQDVLQRLYQERIGGLSGLASLPSAAPQIAQGMAGIGQTQAAGLTAAAQARQSGLGNVLGGAASLYGELGGLSGITSGIKRGISALL